LKKKKKKKKKKIRIKITSETNEGWINVWSDRLMIARLYPTWSTFWLLRYYPHKSYTILQYYYTVRTGILNEIEVVFDWHAVHSDFHRI